MLTEPLPILREIQPRNQEARRYIKIKIFDLNKQMSRMDSRRKSKSEFIP